MKVTIFLFLMILPFLGCSDFSIRNIDRPPADLYEYWIDGKHSELEIKKALLECGYPNPFGNPKITAWTISNEQDVMAYKCMLKSGFFDNKYSKENYNSRCNNAKGAFCGTDKYGVMHCQPRPTACDLSWDEVPNRSITKRLNSPYCKEHPKAEACQIGDTPSPTTTDPTTSQPIKETIPYDYQSQQLETMHQQNQQTNYNQLKSMMPKR